MAIFIERQDYEFLLLSDKFCNRIDSYLELLNLDAEEVVSYKNQHKLYAFVFGDSDKYTSCLESFSRCHLENMRASFIQLAQSCKKSSNYTVSIGCDLGIEIPVYAFQPN